MLTIPQNHSGKLASQSTTMTSKTTRTSGVMSTTCSTDSECHALSSPFTSRGTDGYRLLNRDMHQILMETALSPEGEGIPATLHTQHRVKTVDYEAGTVTFENGKTIKADMIIGSDGIRSAVRPNLGIE